MNWICRLLAILLLPTLAACDSLCYGFSVVPPEETRRTPMKIDTEAELSHAPVGDPAVIPLLSGAPRSSVVLVTVQDRVPPHIHKHSDETIYILEGEGDLLLDQEWIKVKAGMLVYVPMNVPHAYINRAPGGSVVLATYTPPFVEGDRVPIAEARRR